MSCLFVSLVQTFKVPKNAKQLRQEVCDFLSKNPMLFSGIKASEAVDSSSLDHYVAKMRKQTTMGGGIEIAVFSIIYDCSVVVVMMMGNKNREVVIGKNESKQKKIYYTGAHYLSKEEKNKMGIK